MIDVNNCLSNADDFFEVASYIDNQKNMFEYKYLSVLVTNLSFACELYLKFLLLKSDRNNEYTIRMHNLKDLFSALKTISPDVYLQVVERFESGLHTRSVEELLNMDGNSFVDFRYLYELDKSKAVHITELGSFARALKETANTINNSDNM